MRLCPHCKGELPTEAFYGPTASSKCSNWCIECSREAARNRKKVIREFDGPDSLYVAFNPRIPGEIKIGRARNPFVRLATLSASQNFHLHLINSWAGLGYLESRLHAQFSDFRVLNCPGREWFALPTEDVGLIENCVEFLLKLEQVRVQEKPLE